MKIINAHAHLGACRVFDLNVTEEDLINNMNAKGIDISIVQPFPGAYPQPPVDVHNRIAKLAEKYPGRIFGIASVNPHVISKEAWRQEVERCIKGLGFVGIKLHTIGHALLPASTDGMMVFETANDLGVPVMVHTGLGIPPALPGMIIPAAKKYPDLPIILSHAGFNIAVGEAVYVASLFENVYLECSWSMGADILWAIRELGPKRVIFGSDFTNNIETELVKIKEVGATPEELEWYLGKTAAKVFKIKL
ncbi:MAG: amidohydrolase family protein [Nitrososphaeria archaeon]